MVPKPCYVIDGANFSNFEGFIEECNRGLLHNLGDEWDGNLDGFTNCFNQCESDYVLIWKNSELSKNSLALYFEFVLEIILGQPNVELRLE